MTMVSFELFAIAHNLNAELSTLGITSKEAENDSSLYDHLIVNESLREKTRELYFDGHYTRVIEEAFKLIDNLVKEKASIAPSSSLTGSKLMQMAFSRERPLLRLNQGSSASEADEQLGYMQLFAGCMTGVRNPRAHDANWKDSKMQALQLLVFAEHLIEKVEMAQINEL